MAPFRMIRAAARNGDLALGRTMLTIVLGTAWSGSFAGVDKSCHLGADVIYSLSLPVQVENFMRTGRQQTSEIVVLPCWGD